ncbi:MULTISPECIES: HPr family phosphocarrier protein [Caproicibacterium]|jgi:phosphotransferase system HPr (HPr) family protein|uniref:HPr family phosphocarrier protein n=1 Tax=Caproicibacterium lactatifermentans TaxID=2666138 RepID=A0A859DSR9_9FIRM|nr:HPr family phosphocarrier protein [Caproicibacterium lactatifermentans]ARP49571.1 PTS galactitol transporter subunit IIC [Ruminococcaceae bacterium CPB6]MDD4807899.1 HPr family phosphocarrier protein [Oscillospiraceae bacterium]QKN23173.1 HPr family phosphocarrier protein [Caproicibacterium lactatifermentans]QKO30240.1 HPr family phosphocarrier protein [Caproicibacterium lactatifermentans]
MQKFTYTVTDPQGLHARPAGLLVKCAQGCTSSVQMAAKSRSADAKRIFAVMGLGVKKDDEITFSVEGASEAKDAAELKAFCEKNL